MSAGHLLDRNRHAPQPRLPPPPDRYGLGLQRVSDTCGVNWGQCGAICGYLTLAYWNERTGTRTFTPAGRSRSR